MARKTKTNILKAILRMIFIILSIIAIILIVVLLRYHFAIDQLLKDTLNTLLAGLIVMVGVYLFVLRKAGDAEDRGAKNRGGQRPGSAPRSDVADHNGKPVGAPEDSASSTEKT